MPSKRKDAEALPHIKEGDVKAEVKVEVKAEPLKGKETGIDTAMWKPKTLLGLKVKKGEITNIGEIIESGHRILESEITDILMPGLETELLFVGQAKGKFGGGQKRIFKQTQKKTKEGNKPHFTIVAVVGDRNGHFGLGHGKSKETVPAREKATRNAKLNIMNVKRGCGSWQCGCANPHSIPYTIEGKCGSVILRLIPAPKGTGLKTTSDVQTMLQLAGIRDVWSKIVGHQKSKMNVVFACRNALLRMSDMKVSQKEAKALGIAEEVIEVPEVPNEGDANE
ncbi:MAG TPA: 30S ribosomal protein S5 [Candidatus Nanoarchaeia archaeon]|nr:30S ribosomal protein S5 [Candidatus Nanoarchaeia archaeon]